MTVLLLSDAGTRLALKNPEINGRTRVGRGFYSVVFAKGEDEVLRMTADPLTYYLHCDGAGMKLEGEHFARATADFGEIGEQRDGEIPIYLFGTEKLVKPAPGSAEKKLSTQLVKVVTQYISPAMHGRYDQTKHLRVLEKAAGNATLPDSLRGALSELASWAANYEHVAIDFHAANLMVRPETGALVLNDPVHSFHLREARFHQLRTGGQRRAA